MQESKVPRHRIRVLVADSSPIASQLLADALGRDTAIEVLGFSAEPTEIETFILRSCPDVLLISARMQEECDRGLRLLLKLHRQFPGLKAVVLLDSCRPEVVVDVFRSGASGVFCRTTRFDMLSKCIAAVHHGQIWANSVELGFVLAALVLNPPPQVRDNRNLLLLSKREREVIQHLVGGLTNRQIAESLGISQHTVKNYMFKIFDKLGTSNRVELVFRILSERNESPLRQSSSARKDPAPGVIGTERNDRREHLTPNLPNFSPSTVRAS